ncbi:hypothetical protein AB0N97_23185 [Streptomyces collinus]|uniref:hypothetical protein n=1 Tax=Streptomyces collinus TaxID=42684 RepID=UPI0034324879
MVAVQRGPLVYCTESVDLPEGHDVDEILVDPSAPPEDGPDGTVVTPSTSPRTTDSATTPGRTVRSTLPPPRRLPTVRGSPRSPTTPGRAAGLRRCGCGCRAWNRAVTDDPWPMTHDPGRTRRLAPW